jgi:hypothetical protein
MAIGALDIEASGIGAGQGERASGMPPEIGDATIIAEAPAGFQEQTAQRALGIKAARGGE